MIGLTSGGMIFCSQVHPMKDTPARHSTARTSPKPSVMALMIAEAASWADPSQNPLSWFSLAHPFR